MAKKTTTTKKAAAQPQAEQVTPVMRDVDLTVEKRLVALYTLQSVDSEIDKIQQIRGELPQAVQDLEDEVAGLETRVENFKNEKDECNASIAKQDNDIAEHTEQIKKYEKQQDNVRNNREYEAINKEIEYKNLEIQLCERHKRDAKERIKELERHIEAALKLTERRKEELQMKQDELGDIIAETEKDEIRLRAKSKEQEQFIEERYLTAYKRIRNNMRNGLAVVTIDRDACGGCFSKIPHQRQMEIKMHKKVIVCEHCGRILVDGDIAGKAADLLKK
jgi:predicted  nucleic acid-binding Zn-ribbon protein